MRLNDLISKSMQENPPIPGFPRIQNVPELDHLSSDDLGQILAEFITEATQVSGDGDQYRSICLSAAGVLEELLVREQSFQNAIIILCEHLPEINPSEESLITDLCNMLIGTIEPGNTRDAISRQVLLAATSIVNNPDVQDTPTVRNHLTIALKHLELAFTHGTQEREVSEADQLGMELSE